MHIFDLKHSISLHHQHWIALITVLFSFWLWLSRTPSSAFKHMEICVTSVLLTDDECQQSLEDKPKFIHSVFEFFGKKTLSYRSRKLLFIKAPHKEKPPRHNTDCQLRQDLQKQAATSMPCTQVYNRKMDAVLNWALPSQPKSKKTSATCFLPSIQINYSTHSTI